MNEATSRPITDLSLSELYCVLTELGQPSYRFQQLKRWIYQKRIDSFDRMSNVSKGFRTSLGERFRVEKLKVGATRVSEAGDAVKFAFRLPGEERMVEAVLLYDGARRTACLSSQLGCGLGCVFCETGRIGLVRNLRQSEILGQLIALNDYLTARDDKVVTNIVFMGMGEALANYDAFRSTLDVIMDGDCFNLGGRRITVSTAGLIPAIDRLSEERLNIGLAISLNAYDDTMRDRIMPINRRYSISELVAAARRYALKTGTTVTFEYVVVEGENDSDAAVSALSRRLRDLPCKINLIPVNPAGSASGNAPSEERLQAFGGKLAARGLTVTVRKSRGRDISGACGQLAGNPDIEHYD